MNDQPGNSELDQGKGLVLRRKMSECVLPKNTQSVKTTIFVAFLSRGYAGAGAPPESAAFLSNDRLLHELRRQCKGVDFVAEDFTDPNANPESLAWQLEDRKNDLTLCLRRTREQDSCGKDGPKQAQGPAERFL